MTKLINILGVTLLVLIGSLMCAQAFSLFPFQLGFQKGSHKWVTTAPAVSFNPLSSHTFANTTTGKTRESSFRVTNTGNDTLQNYSTSATGTSFSKYSSPSGNINAGSYADVKFRFAPATAGAFDGSILWTAPNMTSKTFHLHGTGIAAAPTGDSCTGDLLFSWHMENLDVTLGTPAGCSVGDTTGTLNSAGALTALQYQDGSNSLDVPTSNDYAGFSVSSADIIKPATAGTAIFYIRIATFTAGAYLLRANIDSSNTLWVGLTGTDTATGREVRLTHIGNGTSRQISTTAADMALDTWYKITAKWSAAGVGGDYLSLSVNDASTVVSTSALGTYTGTLSTLQIGDGGAGGGAYQIDNIKIYGAWQ